jgi:hypothetical protein
MINPSLSGFMIHIKVLQVVVKVDGSSTEVPSQKSRVSGKDGGHVDMPFPTKRNGQTGLPFVEMSDDRRSPVVSSELIDVHWLAVLFDQT